MECGGRGLGAFSCVGNTHVLETLCHRHALGMVVGAALRAGLHAAAVGEDVRSAPALTFEMPAPDGSRRLTVGPPGAGPPVRPPAHGLAGASALAMDGWLTSWPLRRLGRAQSCSGPRRACSLATRPWRGWRRHISPSPVARPRAAGPRASGRCHMSPVFRFGSPVESARRPVQTSKRCSIGDVRAGGADATQGSRMSTA